MSGPCGSAHRIVISRGKTISNAPALFRLPALYSDGPNKHPGPFLRAADLLLTHVKDALRRRFMRQIAFIEARLSPEGLFGLYLTIGGTIIIGTVWIFGGISEDLITGDPLTFIDVLISNWFRDHATPAFTARMLIASALASTPVITGLFAVTGFFLFCKRLWYWLLALMLAIPGGLLLNLLLKELFQRSRPGWGDASPGLNDYSFPSGHTMSGTLLYGFLCALFVLSIKSSWLRLCAVLTAITLIGVIAFSRVYLGAHYLSDVLAAMAAGAAWLAICLTSVEILRRQRMGSTGTAYYGGP